MSKSPQHSDQEGTLTNNAPNSNMNTTNEETPKGLSGKIKGLWEEASDSLSFYIGIETAWQIGLFAVCYRYRPLNRMGNSAAGQRVLSKLKSYFPTSMSSSSSFTTKVQERYGTAIQRVPGGTRTVVATSEWFVCNKVIGIPLMPTKIMLAGWMHKQFEAYNRQFQERWQHHQSPNKTAAESSSSSSV